VKPVGAHDTGEMTMLPLTYEHNLHLLNTLRRCDPDGDLDAAHDAWVELNARTHRGRLTLPALVDRAKKRGYDERRRRKPRTAHYLGQRLMVRANAPAPEDDVIRSELHEVLNLSIERLSPIYQRVIRLRFFSGLTVREVAQRLRIPEKTVYTRLKRGLEQLAADSLLARYATQDLRKLRRLR
jgi:RNA polymerase sigma factor (sigma-70 family)